MIYWITKPAQTEKYSKEEMKNTTDTSYTKSVA